jgi:hypothetical protein
MSTTVLEKRTELIAQTKREYAPAQPKGWVVAEEDPLSALTRELGEWIQELSQNDVLFKKYVYENENYTNSDTRQHRARICRLIAVGETLALGILILGQKSGNLDEVKPTVQLIDQKIKKLLDELMTWHGSLEVQSDIPESFKQAAREVEQGQIEDLDI